MIAPVEMAHHINDPEFAEAATRRLLAMIEKPGGRDLG